LWGGRTHWDKSLYRTLSL